MTGRKLTIYFSFTLVTVCSTFCLNAQTSDTSQIVCSVGDEYCSPRLNNLPRPKGIEVYYRTAFPSTIESAQENHNYSGRLVNMRSWSIRAKFPIINHPHLIITGGFSFMDTEYRFENSAQLNQPFYQSLEEKNLRSLGSRFYIVKPFKNHHYLLSRISVKLNGDFKDGRLRNHLRYSSSIMYGTKVSESKLWVFGAAFGYNFGRISIYPVFIYKKNFSKRAGIEITLPVSVAYRYQIGDKNIFYVDNRLEGNNYNINVNFSDEGLFLEKVFFSSSLIYEREIHDYLWFSVSGGLRTNLRFNVSTSDQFFNRTNELIANKLSPAPFIKMGIFIVPPKKWLSK
ncbi:MAG: DUF6268 family outer membrane beta-barrel protein [Cyclobacteriaceae bacterium]